MTLRGDLSRRGELKLGKPAEKGKGTMLRRGVKADERDAGTLVPRRLPTGRGPGGSWDLTDLIRNDSFLVCPTS